VRASLLRFWGRPGLASTAIQGQGNAASSDAAAANVTSIRQLPLGGLSLSSSIMGDTRSTCVPVAQGASSLSDAEVLPGEDIPVPDEASPLLFRRDSKEPQRNAFGRWFSTQLSASAFLDNNAGLLLVAASQFFFSAMGISVKWLNSLDEPVPTLEVCNLSPDRLYSDILSVQLVWIRMVRKLCVSSNRAKSKCDQLTTYFCSVAYMYASLEFPGSRC
jgi:hypothetical protein